MDTLDQLDHLQELADDVRNGTAETCAKVAEIYRVRHPESEFHHGYNAAVADIAAKIRELKKGDR